MRDPWYGHRDPFGGRPRGDKDEWIDWDYALITALQIIEDNTDQNGLLRWVTDSDRVVVEAVKTQDKFQAAVDARTSGKNYKPGHGERFYPRVQLRGGEFPTYREYVEKHIQKLEESDK